MKRIELLTIIILVLTIIPAIKTTTGLIDYHTYGNEVYDNIIIYSLSASIWYTSIILIIGSSNIFKKIIDFLDGELIK